MLLHQRVRKNCTQKYHMKENRHNKSSITKERPKKSTDFQKNSNCVHVAKLKDNKEYDINRHKSRKISVTTKTQTIPVEYHVEKKSQRPIAAQLKDDDKYDVIRHKSGRASVTPKTQT
eukprot:2810672-Ditylum_brightwellii.AAC.1